MNAAWRAQGGALLAGAGVLLLLFGTDAADMARIWWTASTYNHCLLILPVIGWLAWQRWPELRAVQPMCWWPGVLLLALGAGGWLLGEAASVALARHAGLVVMAQGLVVALLGRDVSRGLLFPISYMLFLVPFGEELVPALQTLTARIAILFLAIAGVPAHLDGVFITIAKGWFEVAEACSGAKFLIAMAAYAVLVANVCFRTWRRRVLFVAAALALALVANGLRAGATIFVAHLTDARSAVGFDHLVYGWIFFGCVVLLLMAASWRFFDRPAGSRWIDPAHMTAEPRPASLAGVAGAMLLIVLAVKGWAWASAAPAAAPAPPDLSPPPGWSRVASREGIAWRPGFTGADSYRFEHFRNGRGQVVDVAVAVYAWQAEGREIVGYGQGAVVPDGPWAWTSRQPSPPDGRAFRITGPGGVVREVVTHYRVSGVMTGSELRVKIETMKARLRGRPACAVALIASGEDRRAVDALLAALGPLDRRLAAPCAA